MHDKYMHRCFQLARKAGKAVKSNPQVGSVLVHNDRIIGEGYHEYYGGPHAEVNALKSVSPKDQKFVVDSTLYVSLEPCCIVGKTPACTDLISRYGIKSVVVAVTDPNEKMNGHSISLLRAKGIQITTGVLEKEGYDLIRPFVSNLSKRPYVILKWAQSKDGYMGKKGKQIWLSNAYTKVKTHNWRAEIDGIMVGHNTVFADDPQLTTRLVPGDNPIRIVATKAISELSNSLLYKDEISTLFISGKPHNFHGHSNEQLLYEMSEDNLSEILDNLYSKGIHRLMIEGGSKTLKLFVINNLWDEARIIRTQKQLFSGLRAPMVSGRIYKQENIDGDCIHYLFPNENC